MKKNVFFLILIISCLYFFIVKAISQSNISHVPDEIVFKTEFPFNSIDLLNSIIVTDQSWFNKLAIQFEINELKPIFGTTSHPRLNSWYKIKFKAKIEVYTIVSIFQQQSAVLKAELNGIGRFFTSTPNDTYYSSQWNLAHIQMPLAWDITSGSAQVIVAVIDGGIRTTQEDLVTQLWINPNEIANGSDDDGNGYVDDINGIFTNTWNTGQTQTLFNPADLHGTQVASVCCASTNNAKGIAGIAGGGFGGQIGARLMIIRVPWSSTPGTTDAASIARGVEYATQKGAHIVNMSLGFQSGYAPIQDAILVGVETGRGGKGIIYTAGSGNVDNPPQWPNYGEAVFPASMGDVIAVGSIDQSGLWYYTSNYANWLDVVAPGKDIWVATGGTDNSYAGNSITGTSYAAPHAAGLAANILSINSNFSLDEVTNIINNTATNIGDPDRTGHGVINPYQSLLMALAYANKTPNISPTIYNNQRILARGQNSPATVLHEVFAAGVSESNEVFYRRSSNNGSGWDLTERLSAGTENNRLPCLTITDEGTPDGVHTVWQTKKANGKYKIYYRRSTNNGVSWGTPFLLADDVTCSSYQSAGPMPVITSIAYLSSYKLVVVWVSSTGLKYRTAYNNQWASTLSLNDSPDNDKVWFPSLMGKDNWTSLTYDTRNNVYSRVYNGVWSSRTLVDKTTTINDRASQIDITVGNSTAAVWYARPSAGGNFRICFRTGYSNNTWNSQYQEFYHTNLDALYPAVSVYNSPEDDCYAVVYNTADNQVRLQLKVTEAGTWTAYTPGSNNRFANITHTHLNTPKMIWTGNQNSTSGPYPIELSQQYMPKTTQANNWVYHRRADIENESNRTAFSIEWGGIEAVTKAGESLALEFIPCPKGTNLELNASNVMDYLATRPTTLSAAIEQLRFHYHVFTSCERDTLNNKIVTDFTDFAVTFRLTDQISKQNYAITKRYSDINGAINDSQVLTVAIALPAGASIVMKPEFSGPSIAGNQFSYSLGHIYLEQDGLLPKPVPSQLKTLAPETFALLQNFPNPFNGETEITYQLTQSAHITLRIFNLLGQELRTLVDREESAGLHTIRWDGKDAQAQELVSGIYIYQIEAGTFIACKKLALIR
ncbi:S8 family serine peptidase [candidate division KSB1 bacterium]|nr:S8 family serine peptidase [candidate division KSB1 bacterium]